MLAKWNTEQRWCVICSISCNDVNYTETTCGSKIVSQTITSNTNCKAMVAAMCRYFCCNRLMLQFWRIQRFEAVSKLSENCKLELGLQNLAVAKWYVYDLNAIAWDTSVSYGVIIFCLFQHGSSFTFIFKILMCQPL